ncbi:hypothetical protein [Microvirga lenta]|uniref:hypothetical protein n=1 Tax=Microvirga lenta TaxID=2881337 RepID=UPI001CFF5A73|nr:hypothetical protein [Microvirga lenta]MCB5177743.1 hypothetical protein [Microvirga lenta]
MAVLTGASVYPGWWDQQTMSLAAPAGPESTDGTRAAAPSVVRLGLGETTRYYLYYMAEEKPKSGTIGKTRILRTEMRGPEPGKPRPANVALEFHGPVVPAPKRYGTDYYKLGPYFAAITPALDAKGEPVRAPDGVFEPWFMYIATAGNNVGVAISRDGGVTFALPGEEGVNPLFPFEVFADPSGKPGYRRHPVESQSKLYDQSGAGSAATVRTADGKHHMFYTARMWNYHSYDDLGVTARQVGHPDGKIPNYGIAYAESVDGVRWRRRTSVSRRVISPAARGTGRLIDPRFHHAGDDQFEYCVTRPTVFEDGKDPKTGRPRYRMMVSSHSRTYRFRSLHSFDLYNWYWDASPAEGLFGFGKKGAFDDESTTYATCTRVNEHPRDRYHCWYTGNRYGHVSAGRTGIGYCTKPVDN